MANIINIPGGGGSGKLTWNLQTGLTAPPVQEDGLWVEIAEPVKNLKVVFDSTRPTAPADKTLFVRYCGGKGYPKVLPLAGQSGLRYEVVAAQYFTTAEGWRNVNAYRAKDGAWVKFAQGDYGLYISPSVNVLQKITRDGTAVWEKTLGSYNGIWDVVLDPVDRVAYACVGVASNSYQTKIVKIDADTGEIIATSAGISNEPVNSDFLGYPISIALNSTRDILIVSRGTIGLSSGAGKYYHTLDTQTLTVTPGTPSFYWGSPMTYALPGGEVWGLCNSGEGTTQPRRYLPSEASVGRTFGNAGRWLVDEEGMYWIFSSTSATATYYYGRLSPESHSTGTLVSRITYGACRLINGDVVIGGNDGLGFHAADANGKLTQYKVLVAGTAISAVTQAPDGTIYFATNAGSAVYRLNADDTYVQIGTSLSNGSYRTLLIAEPASKTTFPELFPSREPVDIYNEGVTAYTFEKWFWNDKYAAFAMESNRLKLSYGGQNLCTAGMTQAIDLTDVSRIEVDGYYGGNGMGRFGITKAYSTTSQTQFEREVNATATRSVLTMSVADLSGEYFIGLGGAAAYDTAGYFWVYRITLIYN